MSIAKSAAARPTGVLLSKQPAKRSPAGELWHRMKRNKGAMIGLIFIGFLFLLTIYSSIFISEEQVTATDMSIRLAPPSLAHPFGADDMGRDLFLRTLYGARYSLVIGIGSCAISLLIGVAAGSISGYYGGQIDNLIMRASDILSSIPSSLLGMVIVVVLGQSLGNLIIAVSISAIPGFIRITRASVLTVRSNEFVEAASAIGMSNFRIIFTQVVPNGLSPVIVTTTARIGSSIIEAAGLSFLGFGVPVPTPEWGALVSAGRFFIRTAPHLTYFPGLFIMVTVLAFNVMGDGLRDALDPKLKR